MSSRSLTLALLASCASCCNALPSTYYRKSQHQEIDRQPVDPPLLFIGVVTAPGSRARREESRGTWMSHPYVKNGMVNVRFFIGTSQTPCLERDVTYGPPYVNGTEPSFEASVDHCRNRCKRVEGCARFTYKEENVSCTLVTRDGAAVIGVAPRKAGATSGTLRECEAEANLEQDVAQEAKTYGDIIGLQVGDSYERLTLKTFMFLQWAMEHRQEPFVMKLDDDTWPHLDSLMPRLRKEAQAHADAPTASYVLLGHIFPCAPVLHTEGDRGAKSGANVLAAGHHASKWGENSQVYNETFYPIYGQGSGYILSRPLVKLLISHEQQVLHNEDASIGYWIAQARLRDSITPRYHHLYSTLYGCKENDIISMNLAPGIMGCMWDQYQRNNGTVCCQEWQKYQRPILLQGSLRADKMDMGSRYNQSSVASTDDEGNRFPRVHQFDSDYQENWHAHERMSCYHMGIADAEDMIEGDKLQYP